MANPCPFNEYINIIITVTLSTRNINWRKTRKLGVCSLISGLFISTILTPPSSVVAFVGAKYICDIIPELTPRQRSMCYSSPHSMIVIDEGSHMGQEECHRQFKHHRWNCKSNQIPSSTIFGHDQQLGTKEAAFHSAIRSAGVLHAIVTACGQGNLRDCGCDKSKRGYFNELSDTKWSRKITSNGNSAMQSWMWGGCSADIQHGIKYSREFWDSREISKNARGRMNLHNYEAGRKAVVKGLKIDCKCHGVSASCTTNTCWVTLPEFQKVGNALKRAYDRSRKVTSDYQTLMYLKRGGRPFKAQKRELVWLQESPSYCANSSISGTPGTTGRICSKTSSERDNCTNLCCGRGFKTQEKIRKWACKCKFYWCCHVKCKECREVVKQYVCL